VKKKSKSPIKMVIVNGMFHLGAAERVYIQESGEVEQVLDPARQKTAGGFSVEGHAMRKKKNDKATRD